MDAANEIMQLDYSYLFFGFCVILVAGKVIISAFDWFIFEKLGIETKNMRQKKEDRELLTTTAKNLSLLQEKHNRDENELKKCLSTFIEESKKENAELREEMRQFTENRIHDRQQSFKIQKELTESIKVVVDGQESRDKQIEALMCGSKELLGDTIDQRYAKYISLKGIPQNEVDEFDDIYEAYKCLKGNHGRETKYLYVKEHLPVIPVETKLLIDNK